MLCFVTTILHCIIQQQKLNNVNTTLHRTEIILFQYNNIIVILFIVILFNSLVICVELENFIGENAI